MVNTSDSNLTENVRDFLGRFTPEELIEKKVVRGHSRLMYGDCLDPLVSFMREHGVHKLELPERNWFLDTNYNFNNPLSSEKVNNANVLANPGDVFNYQNTHINPHYRRGTATPLENDTEAIVSDAQTLTFHLEQELQAALRESVSNLEPGLTIIDGGQERTVEAGRIDITCQDKEGKIVVIELKAGTAKPESLAQILAYMATLEAEEQKPVRGVLVAGDFHDRVVFAAQKVPDLQLRQYSISFSFTNR